MLAAGCTPYLIPKVADGGACSQDYECTSDNCVGEEVPISGPATDGACAPMPGVGEECDRNCADGLYCASDICQELKSNGTACIVNSECESDFCDKDLDQCAAEPVTCDGP